MKNWFKVAKGRNGSGSLNHEFEELKIDNFPGLFFSGTANISYEFTYDPGSSYGPPENSYPPEFDIGMIEATVEAPTVIAFDENGNEVVEVFAIFAGKFYFLIGNMSGFQSFSWVSSSFFVCKEFFSL